jgi:large subunit ribosomal protein L18
MLSKKIRQDRRGKKALLQNKKRHMNSARKRVVISFSNKHIFAQIIDDSTQKTIVSFGTMSKVFAAIAKEKEIKSFSNKKSAQIVGRELAIMADSFGVKELYLDRNGRTYIGRISEFTDALRESGIII